MASIAVSTSARSCSENAPRTQTAPSRRNASTSAESTTGDASIARVYVCESIGEPSLESSHERSPRPLGHLALRRAGEPGPYSYARAEQPNAVAVEATLGALEGGRALLFPAGMAAVTGVVLTMLPPGGTIALAEGSYYGHKQLFDHIRPWGVEVIEYDQTGAPPAGVDLILLEAPSNPMLTMPDFEAAAAHPAPVVCDATLASPLRLRPLERGCDVSLHSATKVLAGHDDLIAGVATVKDDALFDRLHLTRRLTGLIASADTAWLLERGLKTLEVRFERMEATARIAGRAARATPFRDDRPLPRASGS